MVIDNCHYLVLYKKYFLNLLSSLAHMWLRAFCPHPLKVSNKATVQIRYLIYQQGILDSMLFHRWQNLL